MKQKKQIEVKMPAGPKDLRIKHFHSMGLAPVNDFTHADEGLYFLAAFLGLRYNQVLDFLVDDVKKMTALALSALSKMDLKSELPKEITLDGQKFYLVEPDKIGIGWHIDFKNCNITKDPVRMACLFYLQKGFNYSDVDENSNITHPIDSRYKLFEEHFPLDLFIRACSFFLKRSLNSIRRALVIESQKKLRSRISLAKKTTNPFNGKRLLRQ